MNNVTPTATIAKPNNTLAFQIKSIPSKNSRVIQTGNIITTSEGENGGSFGYQIKSNTLVGSLNEGAILGQQSQGVTRTGPSYLFTGRTSDTPGTGQVLQAEEAKVRTRRISLVTEEFDKNPEMFKNQEGFIKEEKDGVTSYSLNDKFFANILEGTKQEAEGNYLMTYNKSQRGDLRAKDFALLGEQFLVGTADYVLSGSTRTGKYNSATNKIEFAEPEINAWRFGEVKSAKTATSTKVIGIGGALLGGGISFAKQISATGTKNALGVLAKDLSPISPTTKVYLTNTDSFVGKGVNINKGNNNILLFGAKNEAGSTLSQSTKSISNAEGLTLGTGRRKLTQNFLEITSTGDLRFGTSVTRQKFAFTGRPVESGDAVIKDAFGRSTNKLGNNKAMYNEITMKQGYIRKYDNGEIIIDIAKSARVKSRGGSISKEIKDGFTGFTSGRSLRSGGDRYYLLRNKLTTRAGEFGEVLLTKNTRTIFKEDVRGVIRNIRLGGGQADSGFTSGSSTLGFKPQTKSISPNIAVPKFNSKGLNNPTSISKNGLFGVVGVSAGRYGRNVIRTNTANFIGNLVSSFEKGFANRQGSATKTTQTTAPSSPRISTGLDVVNPPRDNQFNFGLIGPGLVTIPGNRGGSSNRNGGRQVIGPIQDTTQIQQPFQGQPEIVVQQPTTRTITPFVPTRGGNDFWKPANPTKIVPTGFKFPNLFSERGGMRKGRGSGGLGTRYKSTIGASFLNIKAPAIPKSYSRGLGGLAIRPLISGKRRKRRKK
jgi:hypothetical protein